MSDKKIPMEVKTATAAFALAKMNGDTNEDAANFAAVVGAGTWAIKHPFWSLGILTVIGIATSDG